MVLSNVEIWAEIDAERLVFDPPIVDKGRVDSSSVDLLLHEDLIALPKVDPGIIIDPSASAANVTEILDRHGEHRTMTPSAPYKMEPNRLVIGKTLEIVTLPLHLAARIEGKSSLARLGLSVHVTAPTVLAGFSGRLVLEMNNIGPFPIQLQAGMRIAQLIVEHLGLPAQDRYSGRFQNQR